VAVATASQDQVAFGLGLGLGREVRREVRYGDGLRRWRGRWSVAWDDCDSAVILV
jgi:hypothetical protein